MVNVSTKQDGTRSRTLRDAIIISITVALVVVGGMHGFGVVRPSYLQYAAPVHEARETAAAPLHKSLIFYNRPPKTGSTTVRVAMKKALDDNKLVAAKCFNMIEWNEMGLRTIVKRRDIDFYGCHTRLYSDRYKDILMMRGGNVTFMTSTRPPEQIILSAYLQEQRSRKIAEISDPAEMKNEVDKFKAHVENYPVSALYSYHGASTELIECPVAWHHIDEMRRIAERYEIVVDLEQPQESSAMVETVTGLKPDFTLRYNERTTETSPMLEMLAKVNTTHKDCGNDLVHTVLKQQFNIIKDRLMQNRCFSEDSGSFELCDKVKLTTDEIIERSRKESFKAKTKLSEE